jgi:hypothetical protein
MGATHTHPHLTSLHYITLLAGPQQATPTRKGKIVALRHEDMCGSGGKTPPFLTPTLMSSVSSPISDPGGLSVNFTVSGMWSPVGKIGDEPWIGKDLEGNGYDVIKVLSRHLPGATEENRQKPQSWWPLSQPRFEPSTLRIWVNSVTAMLTRSVTAYSLVCRYQSFRGICCLHFQGGIIRRVRDAVNSGSPKCLRCSTKSHDVTWKKTAIINKYKIQTNQNLREIFPFMSFQEDYPIGLH